MDKLAKVLERIASEVRPRLDMTKYDENEFGPGYDCCGCSTYDQIVEDIEEIIREVMSEVHNGDES